MITNDTVKALAEQWLEGKEYFLVDASIDPSNKITIEIDHRDGVWIDDCCELSRFVEEHLGDEAGDYELEVGSAGIGQPFKVLQQYVNHIGTQVETLTREGKKIKGILQDATDETLTLLCDEKQKQEGHKRPVTIQVARTLPRAGLKWTKSVIDFK